MTVEYILMRAITMQLIIKKLTIFLRLMTKGDGRAIMQIIRYRELNKENLYYITVSFNL